MDEYLNIIIFLIPLAIFIGRAVSSARNKGKNAAELPEEKRPTPLHFEEDKEWEEEYPDQAKKATARDLYYQGAPPPKPLPPMNPLGSSFPLEEKVEPFPSFSVASRTVSRTVSNLVEAPVQLVNKTEFPGTLNIKHLSVLKQAVVMSEILGTPKGLQD